MTENIEKNIEAIENEKKEYLASKDVHQGGASSSSSPSVEGDVHTEGKEHPNENLEDEEIEEIVEQDTEVEVIEVSFEEEEINEWIKKLEELRERKEGHINLEIDDENELLINYEKEGEEE